MSLGPGDSLGPYRISSILGAGGMGEVYRAHDPRLQRDIALKVLRQEIDFSGDSLARFEQEARTASALNHPNLVTVHEIGRAGDSAFIAMELIEGKSLRELGQDETLSTKRLLGLVAQIATGLAAAHERGIVHRDLKPENVLVTRDGHAKILDFGLAKMAPPGGGEHAAALRTAPNMVLGTAAYMSPEQAAGKDIDFRSDQFALGVVLYELLTGRAPFTQDTPMATLASVLRDEPESLEKLRPDLPAPLLWIVERCLAKQPNERYAATSDLARDLWRLHDAISHASTRFDMTSSAVTAAIQRPRPGAAGWAGPLWVPLLAGLGFALLLALPAYFAGRRLRPSAEPASVRYLTSSGSDFAPDVSPDGRMLAFVSERDGRRRIWLKHLAGGAEAPLTEGDDDVPRFSPDGATLLFARRGDPGPALYRAGVLGGDVRKILAAASGGDWSPDGTQVAFARNKADREWALGIVATDGTGERELTTVNANAVRGPVWSPDGRYIAAIAGVAVAAAPAQILIVEVESGAVRTLDPEGAIGQLSVPAWTADSRALIYARAQDVRSDTGSVLRQEIAGGKPRHLFWSLAIGSAVALAGDDRLVLEAAMRRENLREIVLSPATRAGDAADTAEPAPEHWLTRGASIDRQPVYSPDGTRLLFSSNRGGDLDVWELEVATGAVHRVTDSPGEDWDPAYMPGGQEMVWSSRRGGNLEIWRVQTDGSRARQVTADGVDAENPTVTPDGAWIIYTSLNPAGPGVWRIRPDGTEASRLIPGDYGLAEVSPDGRHLLARVRDGDSNDFRIRVVRLADGVMLPFEIRHPIRLRANLGVVEGRARWFPGGDAIGFIATEGNTPALFRQDFDPERDTRASRRRLAIGAESFAISRDGTRVTLATFADPTVGLVLAEGVPGLR